MPRELTARRLFWAGVILAGVGIICRMYFDLLVLTLWGQPGVAHPLTQYPRIVLLGVTVPLGIGFVALSLVARSREPR